ncbi:transmembrane protein 131-like [Esox lucius]|uniref:transmembrane protein 131-like n=1 Tax=Esox lucius TaxID=8010 RepID=UPI001476C0E5|nr:transmembrane protein 131-like [Esox lucius]
MAGVRDFQQGSHCHRKTWINILLGIVQLLLPCVQHGGAQLQALSQMSSVVEVWQAEDADPLVQTQMEEERSKESFPLEASASFYVQENGRPQLLFQPPSLEFGTQTLGLPRAETIYIHNPSQELPVTLLSMFTSSRHFHMPSFHRRVIPPRGKASFKLVFLPTEEGNIENSLFINTSAHGVLSYQVFGEGVQRGSSKGVYRKDSILIFPHIQSIKLSQTQEDACNVTTLGLLLEGSLPKSMYSQPQGSCLRSANERAPAEETQSLSLQIRLSERAEYPADLDKLKPYVTEHILVLLVAPAAGRGTTTGEPKIGIYMLNSGGKKLHVKELQLLSKVDSPLEFNPVPLRASSTNFTQVATLACRGSLPGQGRRCSSHISLEVLGNHTVNIFPGFHNTHGGIELSSLLQVRQRGRDHVDLWLTNVFHFPLTVQNATLSPESQGLLKVANFSKEPAVPHGYCWPLISLQLLNKSLPLNLLSTLSLTTGSGLTLYLPLHFHSTFAKEGDVLFEADGECGRPCPLRLSEAGRVQWQSSLLSDLSWTLDSKLAAELCSRWQSRKDLLPCRWPRMPVKTSSPIDFGATPVNESKVKMMTLKNPSSSVVSMEIRALSLYPAPLEALDLLTKWFNISPLSVNISTTEFTLLPAQPEEGENSRGEGILRLLLQPWESREIAVVFTPSEHKPTTTILLIRNNLTVFDMVTVQGHGAKELLRVGGKLPGPGASLRFNVPQSTLMECRDGLRTNKPLFAIRKSFKVENAGELPLTVMSMNVNGYKCQGFGFEVLQCRSFSLDHNASSEISIAFTPDFTSSWVIRDLTLVTSRGSSFPFTLNVTLPHHMLPLCAQVVPGPSWEQSFWVVTLIFTCFSLAGVCLMAFHQAQYILTEFSTPTPRSNHNPALSRDNGPVNNITPNGVNKMKGSCKTYVDTCHTSDKGKGRGSPAVANGSAPRPQPSSSSSSSSSKKGASTTPSHPQKKHKVSIYYSKYKTSASATTATAAMATEEERELDLSLEQGTPESDLSPDSCNNNNEPAFPCPVEATKTPTTMQHFQEAPPVSATKREDSKGLAPVMFPVETQASFPDYVTISPGPRPGLLLCSPRQVKECDERGGTNSVLSSLPEKQDNSEIETREEGKSQKKKAEKMEASVLAVNNKGKKSRRKNTEVRVPEHSVVLMSEREREPEWRTGEQRNINPPRTRNRCTTGKPDIPKPSPNHDSPLKQNGACLSRPRRKCTERQAHCESGSDSGSSSGSVRASRGSWGSWSSASSLEGDKDPAALHHRGTHHCTTSARKNNPVSTGDSLQYSIYPSERDCYQTMNSAYKAQSMNNLYRKDLCRSPTEPTPVPPSFPPSFAATAASMDGESQNMAGQYLPEETWSPPSVPITNEFRYNTSEALPYIPQAPARAPFNGFPWNSGNSQCNSPYAGDQANYMSAGNANFHSGFPCQLESQTAAYCHQPSWSEECSQEAPSTWGAASCVGSKPYFPGTRSLSPMSSLFGSIWTPQSDPYQSHFQHERSAPMSPVSPVCPVTPTYVPFNREPGGLCRPKQYSSFNPFGPHMNLDIWNSSSNRSSNSQLSNDSGYCGDV